MRGGLVVSLAALTLFASACGGDDKSTGGSSAGSGGGSAAADTSSELKTFQDGAAAALKEVTAWPGPETGPTPVEKGKKIFIINCSALGVGCVQVGKGAIGAAKKLGWTAEMLDGKGTPQGWNTAMRTALTSGADGIILTAVPPPLIGDGLERAKKANIPVVSSFNPPSDQSSGVFAYVRPEHEKQGAAMADWVATDSKGKAKVILVREDSFPEIKIRQDAFEQRLGECTGCEIVATVESQLATISNRFPGVVTSALQKNPDAQYIVTTYDAAGPFASQGIRAAGKTGKVHIVGAEGDPSQIDDIRKGGDQVVSVSNPHDYMGHQVINELVRAFAGEKPSNLPNVWRLVDKAAAETVPAGKGWNPEFDYAAKFESLWTTGKSG